MQALSLNITVFGDTYISIGRILTAPKESVYLCNILEWKSALLQWPNRYRQVTINFLQKKQINRISEITCVILCNFNDHCYVTAN